MVNFFFAKKFKNNISSKRKNFNLFGDKDTYLKYVRKSLSRSKKQK